MSSRTNKKTICYILSYRDPSYIRTYTLSQALNQIKNISVIYAINKNHNLFRYIETLIKLIYIRFKYNPETYILGFRGHEIFWPVRWITWNKYLIFDSFLSPSDALIKENKAGPLGQYIGKLCYPLEKAILNHADLLLTDTQTHKRFFNQEFNIPLGKIRTIYVGAHENITIPKQEITFDKPMQVLFYGSFLPLHGLNIILDAIKQIQEIPVKIILIGGNKTTTKQITLFQKNNKLPHFEYHKWVDFPELCQHYIAESEIILGGPFGGTGQAQRVITGKTFQSLAMGKVTIIGKISEDTGFEHQKNCLLIEQKSASDLAQAIFWCYQNRKKLSLIGQAGENLFLHRYSIAQIASDLKLIL